ncbi:MAG: hypothetical protein VXZ72_01485 [Chlamydiota bacterium]|nr:hypothetical protein [Chlamydiota bacterium]
MSSWLRFSLLCSSIAFLGGCQVHHRPQTDLLSCRYIHPLNFEMDREYFQEIGSGKTIETLKTGETITSDYSEGRLHGLVTKTHPYSHAIATETTYLEGRRLKEERINLSGYKEYKIEHLSPDHYRETHWTPNGVPIRIEEWLQGRLVSAQYSSEQNAPLGLVSKGEGIHIITDKEGRVVEKNRISNGLPVSKELFYPNGQLKFSSGLSGGLWKQQLAHGFWDGNVEEYDQKGLLISREQYVEGVLEGMASYYQEGQLSLETHYINGQKEGRESQYIDGKDLLRESSFVGGLLHGVSTTYFHGIAHRQHYYTGTPVSKDRFYEISEQAENIAILQDRMDTQYEMRHYGDSSSAG